MVLIEGASPTRLGGPWSRVTIGEEPKPAGVWAGRRALFLDGRPAFELSFWCGTCRLLFERLEGANETLSVHNLRERMAEGVVGLDDDVIGQFGSLLEGGDYLPLLLEVRPTLVQPAGPGDYFAEEQLATWGPDPFWGLPAHPRTAYYRSVDVAVSPTAHLYEFIVPMVPPTWNDARQVADHAARLESSATPTAVAVSVLDVCAPAVDTGGEDYHEHWGLSHFLLDGHHKTHAAAQSGRPMRLLSLLSIDASLATAGQVLLVPELRRRRPSSRGRP